MYLFGLLIYLCFDFVCPLPFPTCSKKSLEVNVILDCKGELEEQISFITKLENYLTTNMYLWFKYYIKNGCKEEVPDHYNLCDISDCDNLNNIDNYLDIAKTLTIRKELELSMTFIFLYNITRIQINKDALNEAIIKAKQYHTIFAIQSFENDTEAKEFLDGLYYIHSFKDLDVSLILSYMCVQKCIKSSLNYTSYDYRTSFYNINTASSMNHDVAVEYCSNQNSYLLSLETMDELNFIYSVIVKNISLANKTNKTRLYLGLKFDSNDNILRWISGNPYFLFNPIEVAPYGYCINLNFLPCDNETCSEDNDSLMENLEVIDCNENFQHSLVICECQEIQTVRSSQETLQNIHHRKLYSMSINEALRFFYKFQFFRECNTESSNIQGSIDNYLCRNTANYLNDHSNQNMTVLSIDNSIVTIEKVDISKCMSYYKCHQNFRKSNISYVLDQSLNILCFNKTENNTDTNNTDINNAKIANTDNDNVETNLCKVQSIQSNFSFEPFECKTYEEGSFFRCINLMNHNCFDKSHLQNCKHFICPKQFFKCPQSFCILTSMLNDRHDDCPYGEDETEYHRKLCSIDISYGFKDTCHQTKSFDVESLMPDYESFYNDYTFDCIHDCPINYKCVSSRLKRTKINDSSSLLVLNFEETIPIYDFFKQSVLNVMNNPLLSLVGFRSLNCNLKHFDKEFYLWEFSELLILDLSYNFIDTSDNLRSLETLINLKTLNLSHNENLKIHDNYIFPKSLEILDLSYTKIKSLKRNVFEKLIYLQHLNLSYTLVSEFIDLGIPEYYNLITLRFEGIIISNITTNFFKGLTIESGLWVKDFTMCCSVFLNTNISVDQCHVSDYSLSSCSHVVGDTFKRLVIWIIGMMTFVGNSIVLFFKLVWERETNKRAYHLFIIGLAISDWIMGLYLLIIASVDVFFKDVYVLKQMEWRQCALCRFAGFISTLSSEASTFFICLITLDRFLTIKYTFGEHRFNTIGKLLSFILVWLFAFLVALLPVVIPDWKIYSSNGLCLAMPFSFEKYNGWEFSFVIFVVLNFILVVCIALGQLAIFLTYIKIHESNSSIRRNQSRRRQDLNVAKKLAFVALTNFLCWFPVGILGFISFLGHEFDLEIYAWVAVFVLPINSALNPIIYTLPAIYNKYTTSKVVVSSS